ncbi:hypothetical protein [Streptomyces dubilierae]|uniref:GNAT family N-acetyltransferase n=1 Tax=Streptomyces dubilierae TaxID=3075533 RepID=A0ABU2P6R7_9ACTN|nr:hypothetical protein [Streptomyces sp. DSM 41921]MDT0387846.1 hypothetical protein [Streptomyces sp. DSM 41921]
MSSDEERFHLTLTRADRPAMQGWWRDEGTARDRFRDWVGSWGLPGARITLVDEETGAELERWPKET